MSPPGHVQHPLTPLWLLPAPPPPSPLRTLLLPGLRRVPPAGPSVRQTRPREACGECSRPVVTPSYAPVLYLLPVFASCVCSLPPSSPPGTLSLPGLRRVPPAGPGVRRARPREVCGAQPGPGGVCVPGRRQGRARGELPRGGLVRRRPGAGRAALPQTGERGAPLPRCTLGMVPLVHTCWPCSTP